MNELPVVVLSQAVVGSPKRRTELRRRTETRLASADPHDVLEAMATLAALDAIEAKKPPRQAPPSPRWNDPLTREARAALDAALRAWEGTRYMPGQQAKGGGVDCVRFVAGVLDELHGTTTPIETLPQDAALHARATAILAMKKLRQLYMPNERVEDGTIEPGDVLVTSREGGGPGHAMIAGARRWSLWESTLDGVHYTGWAGIFSAGYRLEAIYRSTRKGEWGRRA